KPLLPFPISDTTHRVRHDSPSTTGRLKKLKPIKCGGPDYNGCGVRLRFTCIRDQRGWLFLLSK
ncbi:MAG: hypothetical protein ACK6D4_24425, partial [Planctomyces sp.]